MARKKSFAPYKGQLTTARQLMRHRNIMLGLPLKRISTATIPFGWELDPDRPGWLKPVDKQLHALWYARKGQRRSSLQALADWVTKETGRNLSRDALRKIFRLRPPLQAYLLPLHDRVSIATCEDEGEAYRLQAPRKVLSTAQGRARQEEYRLLRETAVRRKEEAQGIRSSLES